MAIILVLGTTSAAFGHATEHPQHGEYSEDEISWMKRQRAVNSYFCCGPENVTMLRNPEMGVTENGRPRVRILNVWYVVPLERMHLRDPGDPSPFGSQVLLFFSTDRDRVTIWCLTHMTGG